MSDYPNYQLLTSGFIDNPTPVIIDTNYDTSYEMFQLLLINIGNNAPGAANPIILMTLNNDVFNGDYTNLDNVSLPGIPITDPTLTNPYHDLLSIDIMIHYPSQGAVNIVVQGIATYIYLGSRIFRYQIGARFQPSFGHFDPSQWLRIFNSNGSTFNGGRYIMYGITGRGAQQLFSSTSGG